MGMFVIIMMIMIMLMMMMILAGLQALWWASEKRFDSCGLTGTGLSRNGYG